MADENASEQKKCEKTKGKCEEKTETCATNISNLSYLNNRTLLSIPLGKYFSNK